MLGALRRIAVFLQLASSCCHQLRVMLNHIFTNCYLISSLSGLIATILIHDVRPKICVVVTGRLAEARIRIVNDHYVMLVLVV